MTTTLLLVSRNEYPSNTPTAKTERGHVFVRICYFGVDGLLVRCWYPKAGLAELAGRCCYWLEGAV